MMLSVADIFRLFLKKNGNIALAEAPLLSFSEGRQNILAGKFIHRIRAHIQNGGNLLAVEQFLFSFQHNLPRMIILEV